MIYFSWRFFNWLLFFNILLLFVSLVLCVKFCKEFFEGIRESCDRSLVIEERLDLLKQVILQLTIIFYEAYNWAVVLIIYARIALLG